MKQIEERAEGGGELKSKRHDIWHAKEIQFR
jgi:hypothetical protein